MAFFGSNYLGDVSATVDFAQDMKQSLNTAKWDSFCVAFEREYTFKLSNSKDQIGGNAGN